MNMCFFVALSVLSLCPFDISVGVGAFVIGLSQISSFVLCSLDIDVRDVCKCVSYLFDKAKKSIGVY